MRIRVHPPPRPGILSRRTTSATRIRKALYRDQQAVGRQQPATEGMQAGELPRIEVVHESGGDDRIERREILQEDDG